jgi:hypothetical protein
MQQLPSTPMLIQADEIDPIIKTVHRFVTPLIRVSKRHRPEAYATGLLVQTKEAQYLISAAHALEERKIYFCPGKYPKQLVGVGKLSRPPGQRPRPDYDAGVARLAETLPPPHGTLHPLDISRLHPLHIFDNESPLAFVGYPSSKTKVDPKNKTIKSTFASVTHLVAADPSMYPEMNIDSSIHLIFNLNRTPVHIGGKSQQFPDPHGLSGSPVWIIRDDGPYVVAIMTEYYKNKNMAVATHIHHVTALLTQVEDEYRATSSGFMAAKAVHGM